MPSFKLDEVESPAPSTKINWSPQQQAVFDAVSDPKCGSIRVDAVAGAGKTTTLVEACYRMQGRVAFGAFNKRIADEIKAKVRGAPNVRAGTMHSFGFSNWKQTAPDCEVDGDKLEALCERLDVPVMMRSFTRFMVSMLKQGGVMCPAGTEIMHSLADHYDAFDKLPDNFAEYRDPFEFCNPVLQASIESSEDLIDFDDMLYMPLFYGHIEREFDWVLVDEAQDTNYCRRRLVEQMLLPNGRVVAVGDPHQAIYGFTGADADALDLIASAFSAEYLPLTITYRCPKRIVEHARQWVSHITAADEAPDGVLSSCVEKDFFDEYGPSLNASDAVLCRYTRPVVSTALALIRRGIGARVEGREIGQQLLALANRWKTANTLSKLRDRVETWQYSEFNKYKGRGMMQKAKAASDKVESLIAVIDSLKPEDTIYNLRTRIQSLFGDTEPGKPARVVTLSTVHKAKGREWDRVFILGREQLMPSQWAKQDWEMQQEKNLIYVAVTRAKRELVEVEYYG